VQRTLPRFGHHGRVSGTFANHHDDDLREVERAVSEAMGEMALDVQALLAVSNVFRAATALRAYLERSVLHEHRLSWSAFVTLFVLRVWGAQESHRLASEVGVTPGTLSGVVDTLERRGLVARCAHTTDKRRVVVKPTASGLRVVNSIMPRFNEQEVFVTSDLDAAERDELSRLLRRILRTLDRLRP
jgi:MarR family transcriptional regulator, organic hydroperoxide resistance regulator